MNFKISHSNITVFDLKKSMTFYKDALGLNEVRRHETPNFTIVYLGDGISDHKLELTWLRGRADPYNLGDNEIHIAFETDDYDQAYEKHKAMGCICYENASMGIYFISDPDGYWLEIIPKK